MPDLRTVLTETLEHASRQNLCDKGMAWPQNHKQMAEWILAMSGVAVTQLPDADPDNDPTLHDASFKVTSDDEYMTGARTPRVCVDAAANELYTVCTPSAHISATEARSYAAALLAAALSVEGNTSREPAEENPDA